MAGKPGKSGRRSNAYEKAVREVNDREIGIILSKSARIVNEFLDNEENPIEARAELASRFLLKAMPQKVDGDFEERRYHEITIKLAGLGPEELRAFSRSCRVRALPPGTDGASEVGQALDQNQVG